MVKLKWLDRLNCHSQKEMIPLIDKRKKRIIFEFAITPVTKSNNYILKTDRCQCDRLPNLGASLLLKSCKSPKQEVGSNWFMPNFPFPS